MPRLMVATPTPTLLLAVADPKRRAALQRRLAATGIPVSTPTSGAEAQRLVTCGAYALLILDTGMPGLEPQTLVPGADSDAAAIVLLHGPRDQRLGGDATAGTTLFLPADLPDASLLAIAATLLDQGQRLARARETAGQLRQVFEEAKENLQRVEFEQHRTGRDLSKLRQRFYRLIDANPAVIYATEVQGEYRCLFVSRRFKELLGYKPEQMVGNNTFWLERIHPGERERVMTEFESLVAAGGGTLHYRFQHADGSWHSLRDDFSVHRDKKGRAQEIIGCWSDITTEKAASVRFETIVEATQDGILMVDTDGVIHQANPALARIFGYTGPDALEGKLLDMLLPEALRRSHTGHLSAYFRKPVVRPMDNGMQLEGLRADGSTVPLEIALTPLPDLPGGTQVLAVVRDVSEQRAREQRIEDLLRAYTLLSTVNQAVVSTGAAPVLLQAVCRIATQAGGYRLAWIGWLDAQGHWLEPVASAGETAYLEGIRVSARVDDPEGQGPGGQAIRGGEAVVFENLQADPHFAPWREAALHHGLQAIITLPLIVEGQVKGALFIYSARPQRFSGEERALLAEMASDLGFGIERIGREERRQAAEDHIRQLAYHDELTGLYNRNGFLQAVAEALAGGRPLAVAVFDLARLREINLSLGYEMGDTLLRALSRRLSGDAGGCILGHLGASVFTVVLPGVRTEGGAAGRLEVLLGMLDRPFELEEGVQIAIQYHAGLALAPRDGDEAETLLRRAGLAKESTKGTPGIGLFRAEMEPAPGEQALLARLVLALDSDQFRLHFQPKMDFGSGRITAVEALVRWQDPDAGLQAPGRFIPLLEKSGLMTRLTPQLLAEAAATRARWLARGLDIHIAVNISAADLANRGLPERVRDACSSAGIGVEGLLLELTETAVLQESPVVTENLAALARLGIKLSIDDFGTGNASLSRLVDLPVSQIKVDQSFVSLMLGSFDKHTIVEAAIFLGRRLGLEVVAEGIEDVATLALLHEMGCDQAQGYVISRPLPEKELLTWLEGYPVGQ